MELPWLSVEVKFKYSLAVEVLLFSAWISIQIPLDSPYPVGTAKGPAPPSKPAAVIAAGRKQKNH